MKEEITQEETTIERKRSVRIFLILQAIALAAGNYVGWTTIFKEASDFCSSQGHGFWSLMTFGGTVTKNPLLTPCFWGSVAFIFTLAWTLALLLESNSAKLRSQLNKLWWLLLGGTLFAAGNNILPIYRFYTKPAGSLIGCSSGVVTNPYVTSCFLGFSAFLAAFIFATFAKRLVNKLSTHQA